MTAPTSPHALAESLAADIRKRGGVARVLTFRPNHGDKFILVQEFIERRWSNVKRFSL